MKPKFIKKICYKQVNIKKEKVILKKTTICNRCIGKSPEPTFEEYLKT